MGAMTVDASMAMAFSFLFVHVPLTFYAMWLLKTINLWSALQIPNVLLLSSIIALQAEMPGSFILIQAAMLLTTVMSFRQYIKILKEGGGQEPADPPLPD